jgi:hypothetical protein
MLFGHGDGSHGDNLLPCPVDRYFKMSVADAKVACRCYETFIEQTQKITKFLSVGREVDQSSASEIPNLKAVCILQRTCYHFICFAYCVRIVMA